MRPSSSTKLCKSYSSTSGAPQRAITRLQISLLRRKPLPLMPPSLSGAPILKNESGNHRACACLQESATYAKQPSDQSLRIWRDAEAVCFDVDSTLCEDESIDELATYLGFGEAVAALTAKAMGGALKFEDTLAARLSLMQPSAEAISSFLDTRPPRLTKGIPELVEKLQGQGKKVFLVSGGFRVIINPIAEQLGIPLDNVFANTILHEADGTYSGFDKVEMTSCSGGKLNAVVHLKEKYGFKLVVMVGDGATDLEARQPGGADIFIGYGGTVVRPNIAAQADWYIYDIQTLIDTLRS